jgi:hypothetical protein
MTLKTATLVTVLFCVSACGQSTEVKIPDVSRLCSLSQVAFKSQDFAALFAELERQLGTPKSKMRIGEQGVSVQRSAWFVEETGFFVAKLGIGLPKSGTDPSFEHIDQCLYRYRIKG